MSLKKILAISGKPGLFELQSQTRGGFVVQSLENGRKIAIGMQHNVSMLSEIAIYTDTDEIPLAEIFNKIKEKEQGETSIKPKAPKEELQAYFEEILPDYDRSRVYPSDMKKVIQWYNLLYAKGITQYEEETEETPASDEEE